MVQIFDEDVENVLAFELGAAGHVGRDEQILQIPELAVRGQRLGREDVQRGRGDALLRRASASATWSMMPPRDMPTSMAMAS